VNLRKSIADILCESSYDVKKFRDHPSTYLQNVTEKLKAKLVSKVTNQRR
jgi:hypothetical protein